MREVIWWSQIKKMRKMKDKMELNKTATYSKLEEYLIEFSNEAENWFNTILNSGKNFLKDYDVFFKDFFKKDLSKLTKEDIEKIAENTHSFNRLPLAKSKAINNLPDNFVHIFSELLKDFDFNNIGELNKEIKDRMNAANEKLPFWGISSISELIAQKFPKDYVFYNFRDKSAIIFLNLHLEIFEKKKNKGKNKAKNIGIGEIFIEYNEYIQTEVFDKYKEIVKFRPSYKNEKGEKIEFPVGIQVDQFFSWIYETKIKQISPSDLFKSTDIDADSVFSQLETISIENYFTIKKITIDKLNSSKEIYFLGENGVGKTILLQAILLAAKWNLIKQQKLADVGIVKDFVNENKELSIKCKYINGEFLEIISKENIYESDMTYLKNFFAYGTSRTIINNEKDGLFEFLTLFGVEKKIIKPIDWLIRLYYRELDNKFKKLNDEFLNLEKVIPILENLLEEQVKIEVSFDKVTFFEKNNELKFEQLSDGYRSLLNWVIDMLARLSESQPNINKVDDFVGTVIIDELDLFLHPKWAYKIIEKLRGWFPNIQFIISTHSPSLILGASKDAIFYKVYKENGETKVTEPVSGISNLMANSIITSPLFDLPQAYSRVFNKSKETLRMGNDFITDKIHDFVSEKIKQKNNITEDNIMDLIKESYNNI